LNRAIELDPDHEFAYNNRGAAYLNLGEYERAIEDLNRAIELNPDYGNAYLYRGISYYLMSNPGQALDDWQTAEALLGELPQEVQAIREQVEQQITESTQES
jgi:tetratricopeptide (TPR) repeat protein